MQSARSYSRMERLKPVSRVVATIIVSVLALFGLLSLTRGTPLSRVGHSVATAPPAVGDSTFLDLIGLLTGTHMGAGNRVDQLLNGDGTYPRFWADLRSARQTITAQNYYAMPGAVADTFAAILKERARAGVQVRLLLDAFGSQSLKKEWAEDLERAGVHVAILRRLKWYSIHDAGDRSHVRAFVIDGRIGYTGGFGLADYWLGNGRAEEQWRESNVRFEGPAVRELQAAFAAAWVEPTGELLVDDKLFPKAGPAAGDMIAGLLYTSPTRGSTSAERFLALTIAGATRSLYIANSYFVPDDDFRELLIAAARRGVDVRILTANHKSDVAITWYAGRARYVSLLSGGIRIFEYQPAMMHAKTIVADGIWSSIGAMNFDNRSLAFNNESNLVVWDRGFGLLMDSTFTDDLRYAREITLPEFRKRPWTARLVELTASALQRLL
jgi:cardiolipin synthase A/B